MRVDLGSVDDGRGRSIPARMVLVLAVLLLLGMPRAAVAQADLNVGEQAGDGRVTATVTSAVPASSYADLPGNWLVVDVALSGGTGLDLNALLDWKLVLASGTEIIAFPGAAAQVNGGHLESGQSANIQLGFLIIDGSGPGAVVFQPFLDPAPLGRWAVTVEAAPTIQPTASLAPEVTIPVLGADDPSIVADPGPPLSLGLFEHVVSFDALYDVQPDGSILVTETIEYDFGPDARHGIFRDLAAIQPIDDDHERLYPLSEVSVSTEEGTPGEFEVLREGDFRRIKIGDPDLTITGRHRYVVTYRLGGALNPQAAGPELYFNVTGRWTVPMGHVTIEVRGPGGVRPLACFAGPTGSTDSCTSAAAADGGGARYTQADLAADEQMTIVAGLAAGTVEAGPPVLAEAPRDIGDAVEPGPMNIGGAAGIGAAGVAAVAGLVWRRGRDLVSSGSPVEAMFAPDAAPSRRLPVLDRTATPVEFVPPEGSRPGLVGTLYDERADPLDVSATIVDLAVRGYLRIEEIPKAGWFGKGDHRLVRLKQVDDDLMAYERILLSGLFAGRDDAVQLSELRNTFAVTLERVKVSLYAETVHRRWFESRPDKVRARWIGIGAAVSMIGAAAVAVGVWLRYWVWPGAALGLVGLIFLAASRWMPRRTAQGTATLRQVEGFRRFIADSEKRRAEFAERQNLFTEYLPYAVVFGCVDRWASTFADLVSGEMPDTSRWYVGTGRFDTRHFTSSVNHFSSAAGSTMSSTPGGSGSSGSSGGSSGGGGGGGGGGSW